MSSVLVAYATRTGSVTGIAERIAQVLERDGVSVDVQCVEDWPDPSPYDAVIVGSSVRESRWLKPASEWLEANAGVLRKRPLAMFTVALTCVTCPEKTKVVHGFTAKLIKHTDLEPVALGAFTGWYIPEKFTPIERAIVRGFGAAPGDYRDWDAIEAWTRDVRPKLGV